VTNNRPAIPDQIQHETVEVKGQISGQGFVHDHESHASILFGRQIQPRCPISRFNLLLAEAKLVLPRQPMAAVTSMSGEALALALPG
jgi:hypothetical protein